MKQTLVDFQNTGNFTSFFLDYISGADQLTPFYDLPPVPESFLKKASGKKFPAPVRKILCEELEFQYKNLEATDRVLKNIESLKDSNTFTVTTGHQLNIFTGPLYVIYKLVTVIETCRKLNAQNSGYNFVPVYWMASEDHDFEEINHFHFNTTKYTWNTEQQGAVGRFSTADMKNLLHDLSALPSIFHKSYNGRTLAEAVRTYIHHLFGSEGLVVIDADSAALKKVFTDVMIRDILQEEVAPVVRKTTESLQKLGYQTPVNPRDINFFYLTDEGRFRILREDNTYRLLDSERTFTTDEIRREINEYPERFSPNVVLRPLYEEMILPNLGYIGGPSELVYWLQLKDIFDKFQVDFPILMPRNFAAIIPATTERKRDRTGLDISSFFRDVDDLLKDHANNHANQDLTLTAEKAEIEAVFERIATLAATIDPTLVPHTEAQEKRTIKRLDGIQKKFIRAEKRKYSDFENQVRSIKETLCPAGNLQERRENFLTFYQSDPEFIQKLHTSFDPFDYRFNILTYGG